MPIEDPKMLRALLANAKVIAVVGHSNNPLRTSYRIGQYLREAGYNVYAVNPTIKEINGEPVYPSLTSVPEPIDIVDVFRRSEYVSGIVDEAIQVGAKVVWMQLGIIDNEAAQRAERAGLNVIMDRCIMVDHENLIASNR